MQHSKTRGGTTGSNTKPRTLGPKVVDHRWQRAPASKKKRAGRVPELEIQLARLQEELKKTKDELSESESRTKLAYEEAEEAKKQLAATSAKLDESQNQLHELWASINENQKLNIRLQKSAESEAAHAKQAESAHDELLTLKSQLSETVDLIEELKIQLNESKDSKDENVEIERAMELASALAASAEMESELRKLKVQTEQWRKAAEVAAAMVLDGDDGGGGGKFVDSFEFNVIGEKSNSCYSEDTEDESSMKKTSNMLKKIGVLLKKGQKL
ncbi:hypothetical protein L1987_81625 [Smallanthus sonchifolius]|uniref:Uncharacterized protein n=1 Tax=Smallanthus sonchifolius TaxID=185202 RepID=A0ACB8YR42_9ASTR|nr:hypothetical protein L1987_81625 [Smallanthus sonchifolius]